jgi:hypothetical protein
MADKKFGVAFSGGGIRSAAFCSGVLRRLITKKKEPDFLSCVSGGGYTGSAYVQWKYHKGTQSGWTDAFFDHMRAHTGHFCNWQNCCQGIVDSCVLVSLLLLVAIIFPVVGWGSFACPIAFVVNLLYGRHFLDGKLCRTNAGGIDCRERTYLFFVSFVIFIAFHLLEYCFDGSRDNNNYLKMKAPKVVLKLGQFFSGATFAFTFFPWFINDYLQYTDLVIRIAIYCCLHGGFLVFRSTSAQVFLASYFDLCLLFCGVLARLQGGFVHCKIYRGKIPKWYDCLFGRIRSVLGSWRFSTSFGSYI